MARFQGFPIIATRTKRTGAEIRAGGQEGRSTGQIEDCCLRLAGKYRDPLSNFQATPARPGRRLAAQARPDQGRRKALSWPGTGFIFSQLPAVHLLLSTSPFLPATGIPSFLPFLFSSSIHLHSIHQRTLASLISQTFKMSPNDNVKVLGMPVSTQCLHPSIPKKIPSLQQPRQQHRELRNHPAPSTRSSTALPIPRGRCPRSP